MCASKLRDAVLVDEHLEVAGMREIDLRREQGGGEHAVVLLGREIGERDRKQRAADAIADACALRFSPVAASTASSAVITPSRMYCSKLFSASLASGLTQETTNTVIPLSTHHLMKDFSGVRSRM